MTELLVGIGIMAAAGLLGWICISIIYLLKAVDRLKTSDIAIKKDMDGISGSMEKLSKDLKDSFKEMRVEVKEELGALNKRIDGFVKTELDELKDIIQYDRDENIDSRRQRTTG